jgi:outer membrane protein assembly factor BamA
MSPIAFPRLFLAAVTAAVTLGWAAPAAAQAKPCPEPANLPPTNSPVLVRCMELVAHPVNETIVEQQTYDYYIKSPRTNSANRVFAPYDEDAIKADFWSLWRTGFLDNLWIEVIDEPYANGVAAKHVIFHIEERARVKAVDYMPALGTKTQVETSKIEEQLKERNVRVNLDSFVDEATIRRVKGIIREVYAEKGYQDVVIDHKLSELPAGPKLVHLTFTINQGPKYKIKSVTFDGNTAFSDSALRSQLKENKPKNWYSFLTSSGTYLES